MSGYKGGGTEMFLGKWVGERRAEGLKVQGWEILGSFREEGNRWLEVWAEKDEICRSEEAGVAMRQAPPLWESGCGVLATGCL